jgi:hypothetical protein
MPLSLETVVAQGLIDPETGWSMGSFGAIAEFHHVGDEVPPPVVTPGTQITARGGVQIARLQGVRPVAYELLSPRPHRWSHAMALCLPEAEAMMHRHKVLTDLGPDHGALRKADRGAILFDMGLDQPQVDFCIRTADPDLLAVLRANAGRSLFDHDNPAMMAILKAHPHRVTLTRIGRVEVYQLIGGPDTGDVSPAGPHTHVLPKLLRAGRTHSANAPIPDGWVPCAHFHPGNPVIGRMGEDRDLVRSAFDAFQRLLKAWGPAEYREAKAAVWSALARARSPETHAIPSSRTGRAGLRNGLRQWRRLHGDSALLSAWSQAFDAVAEEGPDPVTEEPEH